MKKLFLLFALAIIASIMQFSFPSTALADTMLSSLTLFQTLQPTLMVEAQAEVTDQPVVHQTTWGAMKSIYRGNTSTTPNAITQDSTSASRIGKPVVGPMNATDGRVGPFPGGDWSSRVAWEAGFALSQTHHDGTSNYPAANGVYYGDWNYCNNDPTAYKGVMAESKNLYGNFMPGSGYSYSGMTLSHQGTCTWFVREVLYRATYWAGYGWHLTTPGYTATVWSWANGNYMTQSYWNAKPGWVLTSPYNHMAIAYQRGTNGWWVIDSNWVGPGGTELIGKHFMTDNDLRTSNYWAWCPTLATTN